ncbi:MAG: hypothetical protein Q7K35_05270 [bacterium]|nr:hypothetical protein [bacterium]
MVKNLSKNKIYNLSPKDLAAMQDAAGRDILKEIGPISKEEYDYYKNLK